MPRTVETGDIVLVAADPAKNNGADTAPAIVVRTWTGTSINVRVLYDSQEPAEWRTSLVHADTLDGQDDNARPYRWTWPTSAESLTTAERLGSYRNELKEQGFGGHIIDELVLQAATAQHSGGLLVHSAVQG